MIQGTQLLAKSISDSIHSNEYDYRNYCGRAYYTTFHSMIEYLDNEHGYRYASQNNKSYTNMGSHERLLQFMLDHINIPSTNYHKDYKRLIIRLKTLRAQRVHADYFLDKPMTDIDSRQAKTQLEGILNLLASPV